MSNTDSFIDEVSEEVRRDRLYKYFRQYGWIAALAVVLMVGGVAWDGYRKATNTAAAKARGEAVLSAMALPDAAARAGALAEIQPEGEPGTVAVLGLVLAASHADQGDIRAADDALLAISTNGDVPQLYRDIAMLKRLYLNGSGLSGADRAAVIDTLAVPGRPFRVLALEQRALLLLEQGVVEGAIDIYRDLAQDSEATPELASRSRQMVIVLGGEAEQG